MITHTGADFNILRNRASAEKLHRGAKPRLKAVAVFEKVAAVIGHHQLIARIYLHEPLFERGVRQQRAARAGGDKAALERERA